MESDSENRRGRGRPQAFDADLVNRVMQERGLRCRQAQNHLYALRALGYVKRQRNHGNIFAAWILGDGEEEKVRWSILTELGRMETNLDRWEAMEWVADNVLLGGEKRVKDVVVLLRKLRESWYRDKQPGERVPASTMQLYRELERTVKEYRRRYFDLSREQAHEAVRMLFDSVYLNYHDEWIKRY